MFTVYSKPGCPACEHTKSLLEENEADFNVIHLDVGQGRVKYHTYISRDELLAQFPGTRTLPVVVLGNTKIGGYPELKAHLRENNEIV